MNETHRPLTRYTIALIILSLVMIGCRKKEPPPPAPVATAPAPTYSTKSIMMPRAKMESHKRLSPAAATNLDMLIEKAHAAKGKVTIIYPGKTPKAVLQSLQTYDVALERDDSAQDYQISVTKPDLPDAK